MMSPQVEWNSLSCPSAPPPRPPPPEPAILCLPKDNGTIRCERNGTSCYYLYTTALAFTKAQKVCTGLKGAYLVAWNDQAEQVGIQAGSKATEG